MEKSKGKKKSKKADNKSWIARHSLALLIVGIAAVMLLGAGAIFCTHTYEGEAKWVYIPRDATSEAIGDSLKSALGSAEGKRVALFWNLLGGKETTAHGAYFIEPGAKSLSIARRIKNGNQTPVKLRFVSVRSLEEAAARITSTVECTPQELLEAIGPVLSERGYKTDAYRGAFLPDTYEAYWSESAEKLVGRLAAARERFWNEERKAKAAALGLSPDEVTTLASIVAEETAKTDEMPTVARLYLNRLKKGMKLQADPTVKFATGDPTLRRITGEHLKIESPYNTYIHAGLPPGPIRIPDRQAIEAVLNAPANDYLYMCAKEDFSGYHNFTSSYATHLANARRYQAELNRRGIR